MTEAKAHRKMIQEEKKLEAGKKNKYYEAYRAWCETLHR